MHIRIPVSALLITCIIFSGACTTLPRKKVPGVVVEMPAERRKEPRVPPADLYYHVILGELFQAERDWPHAIEEFKSALLYDVDSPYLLVQIGSLYMMQNNADEAVKWCEKAIAIDTSYLEAHLLLASIFSSKNNTDRAIREYETILSLDPSQQEAYLYLGSLYAESGEHGLDGALKLKKCVSSRIVQAVRVNTACQAYR